MPKRPSRDFFDSPELLFVGYSKRNQAFCDLAMAAFAERGLTAYPVNPRPENFASPVYPSVAAAPAAAVAYVATAKANSLAVVEELAAKGVKKVLFQSGMSADAAVLARCAELGLDAAVACVLMTLGGGFHRFHGMLAGVPKAAPLAAGAKA
jgi:acyl-CoA synthetase (NDP forming)